jgi:MFS family permease
MRCLNGHEMQSGARFCQICGTGVNVQPPMVSTPPPPYVGYAPALVSSSSFDGFAIAALVLGIVGGSILAVIFSIVSLSRIKKNRTRGKGMAIGGLVLGIIGTIMWVLLIVGAVVLVNQAHVVSYNDGWNAAKLNNQRNYGTLNCQTAIYVSWIPADDINSDVIQGCRDWNNSYGQPDFRYPSNLSNY